MRVLHVFYCYLPHTQNWLSNLIGNTPATHWIAAPWILRNAYFLEVRRYWVRPLQQLPGMMPAAEHRLSQMQFFLSALEYRAPFYRRWLERQLENERPDLIHAHFGPVACHYLPLARKLQVPLLSSFYGFDFLRVPFEKPAYRTKYRQLFEQAAAITTTGRITPALLTEQGCPPEKIHPIVLGLPLGQFPFIEREKKRNRLRLVQVATFSTKKGQLDTLEAFRLALEKCPDMHLTFAGEIQDKALYRQVLERIARHGLASKITVEGFVPHEKLPAFLSRFEVFIHPSHVSAAKDSEGSPLAITEALATGMPVISTRHADIPTQVIHGLNGFLAAERDLLQIADFIQECYRMDTAIYQQMSRAAHNHVVTHFDVRNAGMQLQSLYEMLVNNHSSHLTN